MTVTQPTPPPSASRRNLPFRAALALVVAVAAAIRCWHLAGDLPDFLEEAIPFRVAFEMWSRAGQPGAWNPHSFVYPSLTIYLHLLLLKAGYWVAHLRGAAGSAADWWVLLSMDPTPAVLPARMVHVAFDVATVALTGLVAERLRRGAGIAAALLAAFSPTLIGTSRLIFTDSVMACFALAALERMLAWHERGGRGRLAAAVLWIGLAAGAKYPGLVALVPLAWLLWDRGRARGLALWPVAALGVVAVLLLTTPYALLDWAELERDLSGHAFHVAGGHLGQSVVGAPAYYLGRLLLDLGPVGLALLGVSAAWLASPAPGRPRAIAAWLFLLAFLVPAAAAHFASPTYLAPVIPAAAVIAAATALEIPPRLSPAWRRAAASVVLAALLAPVIVSGVRAASGGTRYTQVEAGRWLAAHLAPRELVLIEAWGPRLPSLSERLAMERNPMFAAATPEVRQRYLDRPWFHAVALPLTVAGRIASRLTAANGERKEVEVFPSAPDVNRIVYDLRLFTLADVVVTSGAARGRFESDPERFADECRLYRLLDSTATVEARFEPHGSVGGPALTVYRLGPGAHAALAAAGPLPPLWWAEKIPERYRRDVTALFQAPWEGGETLRPDGTAALWVRSLAGVYRDAVQPFATELATNFVDLGRCDAAQPLVEGTLLVAPRDPAATRLYELCTGQAPGRGNAGR